MTQPLLRSSLAGLALVLTVGCGGSIADGDLDEPSSGGSPSETGGTGNSGDGGSGGSIPSTGGNDPGSGGSEVGSGGDASGGGGGSDLGPCGAGVGTPTIDGFLRATDDLIANAEGATFYFDEALSSLESILALDGDGDRGARVEEIVAGLSQEVAENTDSLWIYAADAECVSAIGVAQKVQLACERALCGGGEDVDAEALPIQCLGACLGTCEGGCSEDSTELCSSEVSGQTCEGLCDGTCELTTPGECDGLCAGDCSGICTDCEGTCSPRHAAYCEGSCTGTCLSEPAGACSGDVFCDSECSGECTGACSGSVIPGPGVPDCEHTADCQAQASALSVAHVSCTAVELHHAFEYLASGEDEAGFTTEMNDVIQALELAEVSFNMLDALMAGEVNGELVFETAPVVELMTGLENLIEAAGSGSLLSTVPEDRLKCVLPALEDAVARLASVAAESTSVLDAQQTLVTSSRNAFN
jgi:hypothetical protein